MNRTAIKKGGNIAKQSVLDKVAAGQPGYENYRGFIIIHMGDGTYDILDKDTSYLCTTNHYTRAMIILNAMSELDAAFSKKS